MKQSHFIILSILYLSVASCRSEPEIKSSDLNISGSIQRQIPAEIQRNTLKIFKNNRFHCTGFAISKSLVLTAAHCVLEDADPSHYQLQTSENLSPMLSVDSMNYVRHQLKDPLPSDLERYWPSGDIAWMKPSTSLPDEVAIISPISSELSRTLAGSVATIAGYGSTGFYTRDGGVLRYGKTTVHQVFREGPFKGLITVVSDDHSAPCRGDSGGPLYISYQNQYFVAGIASGVDSLLTPKSVNLPDPCKGGEAVYNDLSTWLPWIKENSRDLELADFEHPLPGPQAISHLPETMDQWCRYSKISSSDGLLIRTIMTKLGTPLCSSFNSALARKQGSLTLANEGLRTLMPLKHLSQLASLNLTGNQIKVIARHSLPEGLKHLTLSENPISILEDEAAPSTLSTLIIKNLSNNGHINSDWPAFLHRAHQLAVLEVTNARIREIQGLFPESLKRLNLSGNNLTQVSFIGSNSYLKELYLNRNEIQDICILSQLPYLRFLTVSQNHIADLGCLSGLTQLEMLSAWSNPLSSRTCPIPEAVPGDICGF